MSNTSTAPATNPDVDAGTPAALLLSVLESVRSAVTAAAADLQAALNVGTDEDGQPRVLRREAARIVTVLQDASRQAQAATGQTVAQHLKRHGDQPKDQVLHHLLREPAALDTSTR